VDGGDVAEELRELTAAVRAHVEWGHALGFDGLPPTAPPPAAARPEPAAREARPEGPVAAPRKDLRRLAVLAEEAARCTRCGLHQGRTRSVFARGAPATAAVAFVGEGPGYHEDQRGEPFVGRAGKLLDKMIAAMGLSAAEFYVCNVVKCRPPDNRTPLPDEIAACRGYLEGQLEVVQPEVIVALGRCAAESLGVGGPGWRGRWGTFRDTPVMPTYHPAYLLRNEAQKRPVWEDLQAVVRRLGRELPRRRRG
jgi:uracil-DNA glycosylase family 4